LKNNKPNGSLNKIKVIPLAAESFGARSMCTLVQTPDLTVLLDAGVSLCPYRYNLLPHPIEFQTINSLRKKIAEAADKARVVTISHYHFDHHTPSYEDWIVNWTESNETARQVYKNKIVLVKNPHEKINTSQKQRAWLFQKTGGKHAQRLETADGKTFRFGRTSLFFSEAVEHGPENSITGWVVMSLLEFEEERFMFAPDVQGPMSKKTLEIILEAKPTVLMIGGPPFYLSGIRVAEAQLRQAVKNLQSIVEIVPVTILEHHALRGESWQDWIMQAYDESIKRGHMICTAAEFIGQKNNFLEYRRKQFYVDLPPSKEFDRWMKTLANKNVSKPPIDF
jgi:uncharacterized protein